MMLLSALLLLPSMASALTEAGYGTQLKRSYTPPTSELSDLRNFDQISYIATNDSLVSRLSTVSVKADVYRCHQDGDLVVRIQTSARHASTACCPLSIVAIRENVMNMMDNVDVHPGSEGRTA
jgi:hypothetical protein